MTFSDLDVFSLETFALRKNAQEFKQEAVWHQTIKQNSLFPGQPNHDTARTATRRKSRVLTQHGLGSDNSS